MPGRVIVNIVRKYLREVDRAGIPVFAGVLFGSHARGDARKDSDIDLLIVSKEDKPSRSAHSADLLWQLRGQVDYRIEPLLVGMRRWQQDDGSPLLATIRLEGCLIRQTPTITSPRRRPMPRVLLHSHSIAQSRRNNPDFKPSACDAA